MLNVLQELQVFSVPKAIQKNNKKAFNSPPSNPTTTSQHEATTKQKSVLKHQSAQADLNTGTRRPVQNLPTPSQSGGGRDKKHDITYISENIFITLFSSPFKLSDSFCCLPPPPQGWCHSPPYHHKARAESSCCGFPGKAGPVSDSAQDCSAEGDIRLRSNQETRSPGQQRSKRELTRAINCSEQLVPETLLLLRSCQSPFLLGLCTMPIPPI